LARNSGLTPIFLPLFFFDFVTLTEGTKKARRTKGNEDFSHHMGHSGGGGEVKYAGSIRFGNNDGPERGKITRWDNSSGHYQPPATLKANSGLPENSFNPRK